MGKLWHSPVKEAGGWEAMAAQNMTEEEIAEMEKQGYDMSPVRAKKVELSDREEAGRAPLFGKDKWREKFANAPMIYGAVVQANSALWLPGTEEYLPAVFVFALDSAHSYDVEWLTATAEAISEMKGSDAVPADCREFIGILRDDQSEFCFPLGASLAGGAAAWCVTYKFDKQTLLPGNRLPEDGIVPFLPEAQPKKQIPIQLAVIPGKYYQA